MPQGDSCEVGPRDKGSFSLVFCFGCFCLYFPIRPVKAELQNDGWGAGRAGGRGKKAEDMLSKLLFSRFWMNLPPLLIPRQKSFWTQTCSLIKMMSRSAPCQWLQVDHPAKQLRPSPNTKELYTWVRPTPHNHYHVNLAQLISHTILRKYVSQGTKIHLYTHLPAENSGVPSGIGKFPYCWSLATSSAIPQLLPYQLTSLLHE